jgi:hypothetical protein
MSIKLMSAIFETEFIDLVLPDLDKDGKQRRAKASTAKLVLLAIADHANDEGESAYPGLTKLERKTALSRQGLIDAISALKYNGLLWVADEFSKLGTNNYTINLAAFPCLKPNYDPSQATLLVKPLDYPSQATLPALVKPLDSNHPITISKSPDSDKVKSHKARIQKAIQDGAEAQSQGKQKSQYEFPADVAELAGRFSDLFGGPPKTKSQFALWIKDLRELREIGCTPEILQGAYRLQVGGSLTVKSPASLSWAVDGLVRGQLKMPQDFDIPAPGGSKPASAEVPDWAE